MRIVYKQTHLDFSLKCVYRIVEKSRNFERVSFVAGVFLCWVISMVFSLVNCDNMFS